MIGGWYLGMYPYIYPYGVLVPDHNLKPVVSIQRLGNSVRITNVKPRVNTIKVKLQVNVR